MFFLIQPTDEAVHRFLQAQQEEPFSYPEVGASNGGRLVGYKIDQNRALLGYGYSSYEAATKAVRSWKMFNFDWLKLCWPDCPIEVGTTVGILARLCGFWSLNAARIVYLIEEHGDVERFGFAYGTLPEHAERGEERFLVEFHRSDDSVWYDLFAFSRPQQVLPRIGYPISRFLQKKFVSDSKGAMVEAVSSASAG